jgi:hypothetical protein
MAKWLPTTTLLYMALLFLLRPPRQRAADHCEGLRVFRRRNPGDALPLLRAALVEVGSSVTLNHIAAVYSMAARRLAAAATPLGGERKALVTAVKYFRAGARARAQPPSHLVPACLREFEQPLSQVLRAWGDALLWLGEEKAARAVFRSSEARQLWKNPFCRPNDMNHPFQEPFDARTLPYFFDSRYSVHMSNAFAIVQDTLLPAVGNAFYKGGQSELRWWTPERAGLHRGRSWATILFWANERPAGVCGAADSERGTFASACALIQRVVESSPELQTRTGQIKLSRMKPGTHVRPHAGPTNARLRMHCSIAMPALDRTTTFLRVGDEKRVWGQTRERCFAFRESCEHEVKVGAELKSDRTILIIDFASPFVENKRRQQPATASTTTTTMSVNYYKRRIKEKEKDNNIREIGLSTTLRQNEQL